MVRKAIMLTSLMALTACTGGGPRGPNILNSDYAVTSERETGEPFALIEVDRNIARLATAEITRQQGWHTNVSPGPVRLGVGDTIQVSIVSTSDNGFVDFTTNSVAPVSTASLPAQTIRETGRINVPPIGDIEVRGKTVSELEVELTERLGEVLIEPSAVVQIINRESARAYVVGAVGGTGPVSLDEVDARLIDVITKAGGPTNRTEDLEVQLSRRGRIATVPMNRLFANPQYNIYVLPDDVITIQTPQRKITVLGAAGANQTLNFDEPSVSLAEALGRSGGLANRRADRLGVFLYRLLPRETARALGANVDLIPGDEIPTIFRFDFTEPTVYFTAEAFEVDDGDLMYISDNIVEELDSLVSVFNTFVSPISTVRVIEN